MEKENKFKLKFPRIFSSSCKTQKISEVIDHQNPIFTPQNPNFLQTLLMQEDDIHNPPSYPVIRPKTPYSSMCKPRCPKTFDQMVRENCIISTNPFPRRKITGRYNLLSPAGEFSGRRCPPASPASPLNYNLGDKKQGKAKKKKKQGRKKQGNTQIDKTRFRLPKGNPYPHQNTFSLSSSNETDVDDLFSSDDEREEEETETLFSSSMSLSFSSKSISLSSDSDPPEPTRIRNRIRNRRRKGGSRRVRAGPEVGVMPLEGKVKDTFAVVKSSSDPYNDFRKSMVEMIIEKQIFGAEELEQLLQCFISLNSPHHHKVIVEVFTEIWDALFSYCS